MSDGTATMQRIEQAFAPTLDFESFARTAPIVARPSDRRAHARFAAEALRARFKYGETLTLVDVSVGGALVETARILRPDTSLALEISDTRTRSVAHVIARVLRSQVAGIAGGVRYRGACQFKRPLGVAGGLEAQPFAERAPDRDPRDLTNFELALKTIVEGYVRPPIGAAEAGRWRDTAAVIDALERVRAAAERRNDRIYGQLMPLLNSVIPALQQRRPPETILHDLQALLARQLPLLAIRAARSERASRHGREVVTLSMAADNQQAAVNVTAEFPEGFALDEGQFRLLKAAAYLVGLVGRWRVGGDAAAAPPDPPMPPPPAEAPVENIRPLVAEYSDLPAGWQRLVVRFVDGQRLRGYTNGFRPEHSHVHVSPRVHCPANERLLVPFSRVKGVFFVKSLSGDAARTDDQTFEQLRAGARKVEVVFRDGEVMRGSIVDYRPNGRGFFIYPPNGRGNNIQVYAIAAAIRRLRFI
jgi:hypothetical protein